MSTFGGVLVLGGVAWQLQRGQWLVPLYVLIYLATLCLTPFPGQYLRYLDKRIHSRPATEQAAE